MLAESYRFLRRVEHALQLDDERQTHTVPDDRDERRRVARVLGFAGSPAASATQAFDEALALVRTRVRSVHERVWFRPLLDSLARSEEHTSEIQSLMRISYAVFCLKKKQQQQ